MKCIYCERETGTEYDEHPECVEQSLAEAVEEEESEEDFRSVG